MSSITESVDGQECVTQHGARLTQGYSTFGQLGAKGGVGDTPERVLKSRVFLEVAGVTGICAWRGAARGRSCAAVLFREHDTKGDTCSDENGKQQHGTNDLGWRVMNGSMSHGGD